ncbi:MAG: polysaccharide deacetylase family protein [Anaerolineales bacterium]|nr:polysaccharide deacetylase family protein [Anaerolineales bacterium]
MSFRSRLERLKEFLSPHALVLTYHQVGRRSPDPLNVSLPGETFAAQMEELRRAWNPTPLDALVEGLAQGSLPRRSVAVTFDDGYAAVLSNALPILEQSRIPATVFVSTGCLAGNREFWWDELQRIVWESKTEPAEWKSPPAEVRMRFFPGMPREDAFGILHYAMRCLPPAEIDAAVERIRKEARCRSADPRGDVRPLTAKECVQLAAHPLIAVGAHTVRHAWLAALTEQAQKAELSDSRAALEKLLGRPVRSFSYPYGSRESETPVSVRLARAGGFDYACANVKAAMHGGSDRFWIPRVTPGEAGGAEFTKRLEEHLASARTPRTPQGYAGAERKIRADVRLEADWDRLGLLPGRASQWLAYRWRNLTAPRVRRKKMRIPVLTALWARVRLGAGLAPLSVVSGNERGTPVHRYYIDRFFEEFRSDVRGRVLEFQNDQYATRFGGKNIQRLDILHKEGSGHSKRATIIADLTQPNNVPSEYYDCIICTRVLHIVRDLPAILSEMRRILKPGGVLLAAVPMTDMIEPWWHELWRFTPEGFGALVGSAFGSENASIRAYGNSLIAAAAMRGLTAEEFTRREMDARDERFAIEVCVRAVKKQ